MSNKKEKMKLYASIVCVIFFLALVVLRKFALYGHEFLFGGVLSDLVRINYPTYYDLYDNITNGWSFWSWNMGIGTSVFTHADVMFDPFTYIMFIFGKEYIADMMVWSLIAKLICEGLSVSLFLDYFKFDKRAIFFSSVAYAFSGYSLIMGSNLALGTILVYFPLILLGIEKFINEKKIFVLITGLFLTCALSYYFFYVSGILAVFYLIFRSVYHKKPINAILIQLVSLAVMGILVIAMAAFVVCPQLEIVRGSARTNISDVKGTKELFHVRFDVLQTAILRLFGNDILGNKVGYDYLGSPKDYFQVTTYTSSLCMALGVQAWKLMSRQQKGMVKGIFICISIAVMFPAFSFAMNAFSTINYRWMFFINVLLTVCNAFCLDLLMKEQMFDKKRLCKGIAITYVVIFAGMFVCAVYNCKNDYLVALREVFWLGRNTILIFTCEVIYILSFIYCFSIGNVKNPARNGMVVVFGVFILCFEIACNYFNWFNVEGEIYNYSGENEAYKDGSAYIVKNIQDDDGGFYRINKSFDSVYDNNGIPSENDAMVQSYHGLKSYNSLNNAQYITFLQTLGIYVCNPLSLGDYINNGILPDEVTGQDLNYIDGVGDNYDLMSYLGVKYHLSRGELEDAPDNFRLLEQYSSNDIKVYQNELYFPLAFVNNNEMSYASFSEMSFEQRRKALMMNTVVYGSQETGALIDETSLEESILEKQNAFRMISFSDDVIEMEIMDVPEKSYISFLIPYDKDWNVYIDGKKTETVKVNISLLGVKADAGTHTIKLVYRPSAYYLGIIISTAAWGFLVLVMLVFRWRRYSLVKIISIMEKKTGRVQFPSSILNLVNSYKTVFRYAVALLLYVFAFIFFMSYMSGSKLDNRVPALFNDGYNKYAVTEIKKDALDIDVEEPLSEVNEPHRVISAYTENLPEECEVGVEYIYFYDSHNITMQIIGRDKLNRPRMWICQYTEAYGWSEYYSVVCEKYK